VLILGRRPGESIVIDGGIRLVVISCDRRGVRLGIEAPDDVGIVRGEIVAQIADENRRANVTAGNAWLASLPPRPSGPVAPPPTALAPADAPRATAGPAAD
jgi:carbon storage regulator